MKYDEERSVVESVNQRGCDEKMSKGEVASAEVLMKICKVLHCNVSDIVWFIDESKI